MTMIRQCENVLTLFSEMGETSLQNISNLKELRALYGVYRIYTEDDAAYFKHIDRLEHYMKFESPVFMMIPHDNCTEPFRTAVGQDIYKARVQQQCPFLLLDFYADMNRVNRLISDHDMVFEIDGDGTLLYPKKNLKHNPKHCPIKNYLGFTTT
jgi:hypothetical protein